MVFTAAQYSGVGGREKNEDSCVCRLENGVMAAAVADGLGGHGSGEIASKAALEVLSASMENLAPLGREKVQALFEQMNSAVS
jgi:protein phosphatase